MELLEHAHCVDHHPRVGRGRSRRASRWGTWFAAGPMAVATIALVAVVALGGCIYTPVQVLASLAPMDARQPMVRYKPIQGTACESYIFYTIATGTDPMLEALWEMKRLEGVDGYVEVTIEARVYAWLLGYTKCVTATGYPVTYGREPKRLRLRGQGDYGAVRTPPPAVPAPTSPNRAPTPAMMAPAPSAPVPSSSSGNTVPRQPAGQQPQPIAVPQPTVVTGPTPAQCTVACERFGKFAGSTPIIQEVVMQKCAARCGSGDMKYYDCARVAASTGAVKRCNALPRQRR